MSILVGFKRAIVQPFEKDGKPKGEPFVIEGNENEGATQEANIKGLSADAVKVYGSNVAYYVAQKGTGDVTVELKLLDVPSDAEDAMLGYNTDVELKAQFIGEKTEPPYCAVLLESEDAQGNIALFGFFKGKISKSEINLKTKEGGNLEPEGETYTFAAVSSDAENKSKGNTMVKFLGSTADAAAVKALVLKTENQQG